MLGGLGLALMIPLGFGAIPGVQRFLKLNQVSDHLLLLVQEPGARILILEVTKVGVMPLAPQAVQPDMGTLFQ